MKKLFPEDKEEKKSITQLLDKKGFYVVLVLCIAIAGITAIYLTTQDAAKERQYDARNIIPEEEDENFAADAGASLNAKEPAGSVAVEADKNLAANEAKKLVPTPTPAAEKPKVTPKPSTGTSSIRITKENTGGKGAVAANAQAAGQKFIMPVIGEITLDYAMDRLVYSKTLEEWRRHEGVDIAADRGSQIKAVADGVVDEVKNDPRFGVVVIIDHKNGFKTVYSNLASDEMVTPNQKVKQGDVIGSVGNTAVFEASEQPHLHFEVLKSDAVVDPVAYLPEIKAKKAQ